MSIGAVRVEDGHSQGIPRLSPQDGQHAQGRVEAWTFVRLFGSRQVPGSPVPPRPYTSLCLHRSHSLIVCFERAPRLAVAGVGPAVFQVLTRLPNGPAGSLPGSAALAASLRHRWGNRPSSLHWDFYATVDLPLSVGDFLLYKNPAAASPARSFTLTGTTHTDTLVMRQILAPVCHRPLL